MVPHLGVLGASFGGPLYLIGGGVLGVSMWRSLVSQFGVSWCLIWGSLVSCLGILGASFGGHWCLNLGVLSVSLVGPWCLIYGDLGTSFEGPWCLICGVLGTSFGGSWCFIWGSLYLIWRSLVPYLGVLGVSFGTLVPQLVTYCPGGIPVRDGCSLECPLPSRTKNHCPVLE